MLKERLTANIKEAMLLGNKRRVEILRGLKAAILQEEITLNIRNTGLTDEQIQMVFAREVKKRVEAADIYAKAGRQEKADAELEEKSVIEEFLPKQLTDEELTKTVAGIVAEAGADAHIGKVIAAVKSKVGQSADGSRIAAEVKKQLG